MAFIEAEKILARLRAEGETTRCFRRYGPSGLPHIGTFGECCPDHLRSHSLKLIAPDVRSTLVAFSDDMDASDQCLRMSQPSDVEDMLGSR